MDKERLFDIVKGIREFLAWAYPDFGGCSEESDARQTAYHIKYYANNYAGKTSKEMRGEE